MMKILTIAALATIGTSFLLAPPSAEEIIKKVDYNMTAETSIMESDMVIYGKRNSRTISSRGYSRGKFDSFTEYLAPEREKGTKMLKLKDYLWIYSPSSDRTIQLSGHMLRQSVMGSDLSYEDMMEDRAMLDMYTAKLEAEELIDGRKMWVISLVAKVDDATYHSRKVWVDQEYYVPRQEELFAKSGQMLKKTVLSDIKKVGSRWYPHKINYKDVLKDGKGTDFIIKKIEINVPISDDIFTKASLKK
jgi:outer membrane lipoprotein-sorting protein